MRALRNFSINDLMGPWYVVQYYASSEEMPEYACMRSSFAINDHLDRMYITMNFSYHYAEDPIRQPLNGNITWFMPNANVPAHWMHTEYSCEYNMVIKFEAAWDILLNTYLITSQSGVINSSSKSVPVK